MYHYHASWDFPYTLGCMRGAWRMADMMKISGPPPARNGRPGRRDFGAAAQKLGITEEALRGALGPPPPDLAAAAAKLAISEERLRAALGVPEGPPPEPR
jgi:hypothetical protein